MSEHQGWRVKDYHEPGRCFLCGKRPADMQDQQQLYRPLGDVGGRAEYAAFNVAVPCCSHCLGVSAAGDRRLRRRLLVGWLVFMFLVTYPLFYVHEEPENVPAPARWLIFVFSQAMIYYLAFLAIFPSWAMVPVSLVVLVLLAAVPAWLYRRLTGRRRTADWPVVRKLQAMGWRRGALRRAGRDDTGGNDEAERCRRAYESQACAVQRDFDQWCAGEAGRLDK